ncbi:MAG: iron-containing redox enzyme family protein [Mycobacteriaceae bacterium]|nr:iron-containing redox enzyme family protein [Mycobacteriaceae bacterium]MBV9641383.1 iron-containing redox enzyme family protein [Mycobacteriaceae bacterium]
MTALEEAIAEWPLQEHPFLQRYAAGKFSQDAVRWWAIKMLPGSNRFNQAFLKVTARVDDYGARILLLNNIYSEHGNLNPDEAHVALYMRFMRGIGCSRIDVHEDDGAFRVPELRFKRFEIQDNEPIIWSLGRFAAIECVLPGVFTKYIEGIRKIFPGIDDHTIEYFPIHCELDPVHTDQLLEVASLYVGSEVDVMAFQDGVRDMLVSMSDMFNWMGRNMAREAGNDEMLKSTIPAAAPPAEQSPARPVALSDIDIYEGIFGGDEINAAKADFVVNQLPDVAEPAVLDLAVGTGALARLLADRSVRVVHSDIRSFSIDERFDAVICLDGCLHYIEEPQEIVAVLRRAKEHLRPGGTLIVELRDRARLQDRAPNGHNGNGNAWSSWLPRRGQEDSDLYALSGFDETSRRHVLDVRNLFHTDPYRVANWARLAGLTDVALHGGYVAEQDYDRSDGDGTVVLVSHRPTRADAPAARGVNSR